MYLPIEGYSRSRGIDLNANVPGKGRVLLNTHHLHDLSEVSIPVLLAHRSEASASTDPYEYLCVVDPAGSAATVTDLEASVKRLVELKAQRL